MSSERAGFCLALREESLMALSKGGGMLNCPTSLSLTAGNSSFSNLPGFSIAKRQFVQSSLEEGWLGFHFYFSIHLFTVYTQPGSRKLLGK